MKRIKSIRADEAGLGLAYMEPIPTFRPPSLRITSKPKASKLLNRLLKEEEKRLENFRFRYLLKQPKSVPMAGVNMVSFDPSPILLPNLNMSRK